MKTKGKTHMKNKEKSQEITPETYKKIIEKHPEITSDGYGIGSQPLTESARKIQYESSRKDLIGYQGAFETSLQWSDQNPNFARNRTSTGLKHEAERKFPGIYIPNGVFILAALHRGFQIAEHVSNSANVRLK